MIAQGLVDKPTVLGRCCQMLILWMCFVLCQAVYAQTSQAPVSQAIPPSEIPARAASESVLLEQSEDLLSRERAIDNIESGLAEQESVVARLLISLKASLAAASSRAAISEIEQTWQELSRSLEDWEKELQSRSSTIEQQSELVAARTDVWRRTITAARESDAPQEIVALAEDVAADLGSTQASLEQMRDRTLSLQGKVGRARSSVQDALNRIAEEEKVLLNNLMHRERPPLWSEAVTGVSAQELKTRALREFNAWWSEVSALVRSEADRVIFQLMILAGAALVLFRSRRAASAWAAADPSVAKGLSVFNRPVAMAAVIALLLTPWLYVSTPPAVVDAIGLLLVLPVLRLVLPLLDRPIRPALYMLAALYVVDKLRDLLEAAPLVARLVYLFEMLAAIAIIFWIVRSRSLHGDTSKSTGAWHSRLRIGLDVALLVLVVATLADIAGFVRLSVLLGSGVLNSAFVAVLLVALTRAADAIVALALHSPVIQTLRVFGNRASALRVRLRGLFAIAAIIAWLLATLDFFALRDYLAALAGGILFSELSVGAISISLADVVAFGVTIFAALLLARLITLILDEDVYTRVQLGRGVPFAISAVVKYGIITLGFLLAVGAMGMGLDKITILLGAFGVGLGFGLQNVVNNFVSGLILIFERPVQIGDSVEVGSVKGTVKHMGIRSSTIRSFEGADITIPNGSLLSDALTNWTMSDRTRRIEVSVGVAYGSNPDEVIEVLKNALQGQQGLLEQPAPQVLFNGFGESSLDFLLRAWVADNDQFVSIRSSVALAVNRGLEERGIEIPFPQRDLHVRSVAPGVLHRQSHDNQT